MITKYSGDLIKYTTKDKLTLYGFLTKSRPNNKKIIIHHHGMSSNFFAGCLADDYRRFLLNSEYDFFSTNNRGYSFFNKFYVGNKKLNIGTAFEEFTESIYDVDASVKTMEKLGYNEIILSGQSTGCQKITYYQSKKQNKNIKALILLAPTDDYNSLVMSLGKKLNKAIKIAKKND